MREKERKNRESGEREEMRGSRKCTCPCICIDNISMYVYVCLCIDACMSVY